MHALSNDSVADPGGRGHGGLIRTTRTPQSGVAATLTNPRGSPLRQTRCMLLVDPLNDNKPTFCTWHKGSGPPPPSQYMMTLDL